MKAEQICLIDTQSDLTEWLSHDSWQGPIAIDLEANSMHVYPEQLCLIQIKTSRESIILDMLSGLNFSPIFHRLKHSSLIFHGADYDLRILFQHLGFVAAEIFDTMWAARLCGLRFFSLQDLVFNFLGVQLDKSLRCSDWAQRPLTPEMLRYANADTRYLFPLADILQERLKILGRMEWLKECCRRLIDNARISNVEDSDSCWRIRGSGRLTRGQLAILRELWKWRENKAVERKRPPYFILSHELLIQMAIRTAGQSDKRSILTSLLGRCKHSSWKEEIYQAVEAASLLPQKDWPQRHVRKSPEMSPDMEQRLKVLTERRNRRAVELDLDPTLIASKALLSRLARDWDNNHSTLMNWQRELLQEETA